jgi:hypothetical protein
MRLAARLSPLPGRIRSVEDELWLILCLVSRWDRLLLFGGLIVAAAVMFVIAFALVPTGIFILKPRKFVVL